MSDSPLALEHEARPELRHHFADEEQQRNAASLGMWWFLGTEIMFFGGMFCGYLVYRRVYFPEFAVASRSLDLVVGTLNTAVLICSSLTVAMSVRAAQLGKRKLQVQLLLATIFFGLVFLSVKGYEWRNKYKEHHIPTFDYNAISGEGDLTKGQESLLGLDKLLEAQLMAAPAERRNDLELVKNLVGQHIKRLGMYRCEQCGFRAKQYYWRCPGCNKWETYSPKRTETPDGFV